jgi:hypothetical protein
MSRQFYFREKSFRYLFDGRGFGKSLGAAEKKRMPCLRWEYNLDSSVS